MSKRKAKGLLGSIAVLAVVLVSIYTALTSNEEKVDKVNAAKDGKLSVVFMDVGQGDSEFIRFPDGRCMLIDAGTADSADYIIEYISSLGIDSIDYLIATHPHADHIGGMAEVIKSFDTGEIYMPRASTNSKTYENLLETISDCNLTVNTAKAGMSIINANDLSVEFLAPVSAEYEDLNNYSVTVKVDYGASSFLFTGDAEKLSEKEMLEKYSGQLDADVLKVGHHGSKYSTSADFLSAVSPAFAIIEVGKDNSYHHPHNETVNRLEKAGAEILRTDELGDIVIATDGDGNYRIAYDKAL